MPTYRLVLEYDGAPFAGWQFQPRQRTVQGEVSHGLSVALRHEIKVQGAGRTDAGVHALGQCASFRSPVDISPERLRAAVTGLCKPHIAAVTAAVAPDEFSARFDALGKHYRYRVLCRNAPSPLLAATAFHVPLSLDRDAMSQAAAALVGTHDFAAFRAVDCERKSTVRTLSRVDLSWRDAVLDIDVEGDAFLKHMVRILAGTIVEVGRGRRTLEDVRQALATGKRDLAGITAPSLGLTLVAVRYAPEWLSPRRRSELLVDREPAGLDNTLG